MRNFSSRRSLGLVFPLVCVFSSSLWAGPQGSDAPTELYVRSDKISLVSEPRFGAVPVLGLSRGAKLAVLTKQGAWWQVKAAGKTGWVPQAFVSDQPVAVALADGSLSALANDPRAARRRGSRASTLGVRGLSRGVDQLDDATADGKALKRVEESRVPAEEVKRYEAELGRDR